MKSFFLKYNRVLVILLIICFLTINYFVTFKTGANDFRTFYDIGVFAFQKQNIYNPSFSTGLRVYYLPYFSLIMGFLQLFPYWFVSIFWCALKIFIYVLMFKAFMRILNSKILSLLPFLIFFNSILNDFALGQVNSLITGCLFFSFIFLIKSQEWKSAILYSIASIKVFPLFLLVWFFLRRQWSYLFKISVVFCGWLCMLFAWFGIEKTILFFREFEIVSQAEKMNLQNAAVYLNQSLLGVFSRLLLYQWPTLQNIFNHSPLISLQNTLFLFFFMPLCILLVILRKNTNRTLNLSEFGYMLCLCLLISPDTRRAHMVVLIIPAMVLLSSIGLSKTWGLFIKILMSFLCVIFLFVSQGFLGDTLYNTLRFYSIQTVGMCFMLLALGILVAKKSTV